MEDKVFELMSKMYSDITARLDSIENKLDSKADKTDIVHIENKLDNNSKALFDGYKQTYEEIREVKKAVEDLSTKVEKQEVEIKVIKGGKS
jgi:tetrahydromethanopterin S-methyltransferase subunit G